MSNIVKLHQPCPHCGSSDALSVYADGGAKCFSCGWSWKNFEKGGSKPMTIDVKDILADAGRSPVNGIPDRKLTADTCNRFGVRVVVSGGGIAQHIYPYFNKDGDLVAQKIRTVEGKLFHVRGKMSQAVLFGQQIFPSKGRYVTITEGELDAMSVYQMLGGRSAVVSIKNGCGGVEDIKNNYEYLDGFDNIILCFDGDEAGQKAIEKIVNILPPKKLRIVKLPRDMKDPSEFLKAGRVAEFVNNYWWRAEEYRPKDIVNFSDMWDRVKEFAKSKTYVPTPWQGLNEKLCGFRPGQLIVFAAGTGMGKSEFLRAIIQGYLTTTNGKVGAFFLEEVAEDTVIAMMSKIAGKNLKRPEVWKAQSEEDKKKWFKESGCDRRIELYDGFDFDDVDLLCEKIRFLNKARDCSLIVLDHLTMIVDDADNPTQQLNKLVADLKKIAVELGVIIVAACHLRKAQNANKQTEEGGRVTLDDLKQSSSVKQLSDVVIGLERDGQSEDPVKANTTKIRVLKDRDFGSKGLAAAVLYEKETTRLIEQSLEDFEEDL